MAGDCRPGAPSPTARRLEAVAVHRLAVHREQPVMERMVVVDAGLHGSHVVDDGIHLERIARAATRIVPHREVPKIGCLDHGK